MPEMVNIIRSSRIMRLLFLVIVSAAVLTGCAGIIYGMKADRLLEEDAALPRDTGTGLLAGAEPYHMDGRDGMPAVLLIHGFGGTPYDLKPLAEALNESGYTVSGVLLAGHGTSVKDMSGTGWRDWLDSARAEYIDMAKEHDRIYVVGFSMGGLVALNLSMEYDFEGLVLLSPCVFLPGEDDLISTEFLIKEVSPYLPTDYILNEERGRAMDPEALKGRTAYTLFPLACLRSLVEFMELTRARMAEVDEPILLIQSVNDDVVGSDGPGFIIKRSSAENIELLWVEKSYHHLVLDLERDSVIPKAVDFIRDGN